RSRLPSARDRDGQKAVGLISHAERGQWPPALHVVAEEVPDRLFGCVGYGRVGAALVGLRQAIEERAPRGGPERRVHGSSACPLGRPGMVDPLEGTQVDSQSTCEYRRVVVAR